MQAGWRSTAETAPNSLSDDVLFAGVVAAVRAAAQVELPAQIERAHSFLLDLGFDSLSTVMLSLALEDEFGCPILLDGWISEGSDPAGLTVGSLCAYLGSRLLDDE
jgi:acyl carrier protein